MKLGGYYTVEATFITCFCVWILVALCFGGLYIHDKVIAEGVTNGSVWELFEENEGTDEPSIEKMVKESLEEKMFILTIQKIEAKNKIGSCRIRVYFRMPDMFSLLKKVFMEKGLYYEATREAIKPASMKWDYDILTEKK